jgi:hypothetical protein
MKTITIRHDGFHGVKVLRFRGEVAQDGVVEVSARVAARLNRAVCGCAGCKCGERAARHYDRLGGTTDSWCLMLPESGDTIRGNYPKKA